MKILHVITTDTGGAGTAALRIHQGLLNIGCESKVLCMNKKKDHEFVYEYPVSFLERINRFVRKKGLRSNELYKIKKEFRKIDSEVEIFTFPYSYLDITSTFLFKDADIINLHWTSGFLDYMSFFEKVNKPVVWTLHDMNPFMGGFHYQEDCDNNPGLKELETKIISIKNNEVDKIKKLTIVTPSLWLKSSSEKSIILGRFEHNCIPYGLDMKVFRPIDKKIVRKKYNIPDCNNLLLFVSENINNRRKGFELLIDSLKFLKNDNISIGVIGACDNKIDLPNAYYWGQINDENILAELYSAADAFILPSREDNLPNTMLESIACGTPVICFPVGGMLDVIKTGFNGILANDISALDMAEAINKFLLMKEEFNSNAIRNFALENYSLEKPALLYEKLYMKML